jgi:hypothetical protein
LILRLFVILLWPAAAVSAVRVFCRLSASTRGHRLTSSESAAR